jgi:hypothetical protein
MKPQFFLIRCIIERGGFSSERSFEVQTSDGGKLIGTADVEHLCDEAKNPLDDDEPPYGERMSGFVKCRSIRKIDQQTMLIDLPSADVVHVPAGELVEV